MWNHHELLLDMFRTSTTPQSILKSSRRRRGPKKLLRIDVAPRFKAGDHVVYINAATLTTRRGIVTTLAASSSSEDYIYHVVFDDARQNFEKFSESELMDENSKLTLHYLALAVRRARIRGRVIPRSVFTYLVWLRNLLLPSRIPQAALSHDFRENTEVLSMACPNQPQLPLLPAQPEDFEEGNRELLEENRNLLKKHAKLLGIPPAAFQYPQTRTKEKEFVRHGGKNVYRVVPSGSERSCLVIIYSDHSDPRGFKMRRVFLSTEANCVQLQGEAITPLAVVKTWKDLLLQLKLQDYKPAEYNRLTP